MSGRGRTSENVPMKLTDEMLEDFIRSWKHAFNEEITVEEARVRAMELMDLYQTIAGLGP